MDYGGEKNRGWWVVGLNVVVDVEATHDHGSLIPKLPLFKSIRSSSMHVLTPCTMLEEIVLIERELLPPPPGEVVAMLLLLLLLAALGDNELIG